MEFTNPLIGQLLAGVGLPRSGTKEVLEARVVEALNEKTLTLANLVHFINEVSLWRRQHVFVFDAPDTIPQKFSTERRFRTHLKKVESEELLDEPLPLVLPEEMQLVSISHPGNRIRATAVVRTTHRERFKQEDEFEQGKNVAHMGQTVIIEKRAYLVRLSRTLISLEWDLRTRSPSFAQLQITEMPGGNSYSEIAEQFFVLVDDILPSNMFTPLDLSGRCWKHSYGGRERRRPRNSVAPL